MKLLPRRTFGENRFDMIHARFLLGSVSSQSHLYKSVFNALKPGGYFEISEMECGTFSDDGTVSPSMPSVRWWSMLEDAFENQAGQHRLLALRVSDHLLDVEGRPTTRCQRGTAITEGMNADRQLGLGCRAVDRPIPTLSHIGPEPSTSPSRPGSASLQIFDAIVRAK